jgi:hypothetical protein
VNAAKAKGPAQGRGPKLPLATNQAGMAEAYNTCNRQVASGLSPDVIPD